MFYKKVLTRTVAFALLLAACAQPLPLQRSTPASISTLQATAPALPGQTLEPEETTVVAATVSAATATLAPTVETTAAPATTIAGTPVVIVPPTQAALSSEQAWQAQQQNREEFGEERQYTANASVPLLWFDPATGQSLEIGRLVGRFVATAQFKLRSQNNAVALAVPYQIDVSYGLTAISPAVKARMQAAGYTERVEAYVVLGESVVPV